MPATPSRRRITAPLPHVLRDYALLADGERGALIGPRGDIEWMCFPRWESDALFSSLVGGAGSYTIAPRDRFVWGGYYEPSSLIWRSRWVTDRDSIVECREALALPAEPGRAMLLRRVIACRGTARMEVSLSIRGDFGRRPVRRLRKTDSGLWLGESDGARLCWAGGADAAVTSEGRPGKALRLELDLQEGEHHDFVLALALDGDLEPPDPDECWSATEADWAQRVPALDLPVGARDARLAYAVLSGLTASSGGMVAAATMALPERAVEGRNYDYRYVWIRDQCFAGLAAAKAGSPDLLDGSVDFVRGVLLEHGPDTRPAYTTSGGPVPEERDLDLPGYPGGAAVSGNHAGTQFQLDVFGESLQLFAAAAALDRLDAEGWRAAEVAADAIAARWQEPDAGIWELGPEEWTHSRLACVAGLRALAACGTAGARGPDCLALADRITADVSARALHPDGRWQRSPTDARVDAALLLAAHHGAVPASDPRTKATLRAVVDELTIDGYAFRFRPDNRPLGAAEGSFLFCGFLLSLAYAQQGDLVESARWFERNRAASGTPGLLAEELDVEQRQMRGNLPQAFVHALLLEAALAQGDLRREES